MAKFTADSVSDAALNKVATATQYLVCSGDPPDRTDALAQALATVVPTFTGPSDAVSGRQTTVDQKSGVTVDVTGTAATVCLIDGIELLDKTDLASPLLITATNTITINAWNHTIPDPV